MERLVYTGNQGVVTYEPEYEAAMFPPVPLAPGETVFLPLFAPHRVINDGGISVSINVGFQTRESRRRRNVHLVNLEMRRLGLRPSPFNLRPSVDSVNSEWSWPFARRTSSSDRCDLKSLSEGQGGLYFVVQASAHVML